MNSMLFRASHGGLNFQALDEMTWEEKEAYWAELAKIIRRENEQE